LIEWGEVKMPAKGTKKVRGHIRRRTLIKIGDIEVKDPFSATYVKSHFRKKPKRKKKS
jgi:hypothetical protein